ncbi:zinc-ribbon domain-containing protein [Bacillus salipaludis]|uniref:zinc ribbon domain-containing protein n=1 Tax=Bacillus salipaludis TaxID=2547811 RepID=UPI003D2528A9
MGNCQNCGHELNPGQKFCSKCGTVQPEKQNRAQEKKPKGPSFIQSKGFKILAPIIIVIAVVLFGGYKYIASTLTPDKIEEKFVDAVKNENVKEMKGILNQNRPELTINDEMVLDFLAYFKKHPDFFSETVSQLKRDASNLSINKEYENKKTPISLIREGKKWLIFDSYAVDLKPYYIDVTTNQKPAEVTINGKSVDNLTEEKATFGPYLLSDFKIKGTYSGKYTPVTTTVTLDPLEEESQHLKADLDLTGNAITVSSDYDNAILYINGKNTGKKIKDVDTLNPVPIDGSMKLQAVLKTGAKTVKSNEESITEDGQEVYLGFAEDVSYPMDTDFVDSSSDSDSDTDSGTDEISQAVTEHYQDISNGDYEGAFNLMSSSRRGKYNFTSWKNGLKENYRNDVSISNVEKLDSQHAVVSFSLTSYDEKSNGDTLVQEWGGKWNLIYEDGGWVLNKPEITKIDSYTE